MVVSPARLERATYSLEGCCSIQLSYGPIMSGGPGPFSVDSHRPYEDNAFGSVMQSAQQDQLLGFHEFIGLDPVEVHTARISVGVPHD